MATLGGLIVELRADHARLQTDMNRAVGVVDGATKQMARAAQATKAVFAGIVAGFSIAGISGSIRQIIDYGDRLRDLSIATGASVEQLSFLDFAAKQSGSSVESLSTNIAKMQKNLAESAKGGARAVTDTLDDLGLSAQELASSNLVAQITAIGEALKSIENPAQRAAAGQSLFGKGFKNVAPLILEGRQGIEQLVESFVRLDGAVTRVQSDKFDEFNDTLGELSLAARSVGVSIAESLVPALTNMASSVQSVIPFTGTVIREFVTNSIFSFVELQKKAAEARAKILEFFTPSIYGDGAVGGRESAGSKKAIEDARQAQRVLDQIRQDALDRDLAVHEKRKKLKETITSAVVGGPSDSVNSEATEKLLRSAEAREKQEARAIAQLGQRLTAERDATEAARVRFEIEQGAYKEFSEAGKARLNVLADEIDLLKESAEVSDYLRNVEQQRRVDSEAASKARDDERRRTLESLRSAEELYADSVKKLLSLGIEGDSLQRGIKQAREELEAAHEAANDGTDAARELGLTFSSAFEDAIVGGKSLSKVLQGLLDDILRLTVRKAITEPLSELFSGAFDSAGGGEGIAGFLGGLFGNAKGGLYRVGGSSAEHPVAFTARAGEVVAVGTGSGSGGSSVVINNYTGASVSQRERTNPNGRREIEIMIGEAVTGNILAGRGGEIGLNAPLAGR